MNHHNAIEIACATILRSEVKINKLNAIGGGSISQTYAIYSNQGSFFIKINRDSQALEMFRAEMDGLTVLSENSSFNIPKVYGLHTSDGVSYLMMDLIEPSSRKEDYWGQLGVRLAELHKLRQSEFGYHQSNFIGSLPQSNNYYPDWPQFFIQERMNPMVKLARDSGQISQSFANRFDLGIAKIVKEFPQEPPSLIHGDLWSGNLMIDNGGDPTIIDPAVYYGHREMDIAFSQMFGGFNVEFYQEYQEAYPLEPGFEQRVDLYNLYPYLVHLNLFGQSYFGQIEYTINRFT